LRVWSVQAGGSYHYKYSYKTIIFDEEIKTLIDNIPNDVKYQPLKHELSLSLLKTQCESVPVMVLEPQLVKGPI